MGVLLKINNKLTALIKKNKTISLKLYDRIITNCFFGLSNKEIEKPLEHNPWSMVGRIRDAVNIS